MRLIARSLTSLSLLTASIAAYAVVPSITSVTTAVPSNELYAGYSYATRSYDQTSANTISGGMNGGQASYKFRILPWVGLKFDASYYTVQHQYTDPQIYFFLAGPQVSQHLGRYNLFVHGLIGIAHLNGANPITNSVSGNDAGFPLNSNYTVAAAVGGGIDRAFNRFFAWRITGDFLHTNFSISSNEQNPAQLVSGNGRISTGPVLRF